MITLLNTSILTNFGHYRYSPVTLDQAREIVNGADDVQSAIGHQATADILSDLLERPVEVNRMQYSQGVGDHALVFKLRGRAPEGVILSREQVEEIGYDFGFLLRIK